jgi:HK97 family phage portal protein
MKFTEWVKSRLTGKSSIEISSEDFEKYYAKYEASKFNITETALFTTISLIARSLAKCEFVTLSNRSPTRTSEYYLWNYAPNKHQTKAEFVADFVSKLIFKNEALIVESSDNQLIVADGFNKTEYALYDDVFSSVSCRNMTFQRTFSEKDVIYLKYNNVAISGILAQMCKSYEALMTSAESRYNKAVGHKGILTIDNMATNSVDFQKTFDDLMQKRFAEYFKEQNAVLPLFSGYAYSEPTVESNKTTNNEINDLQKLRSEIYSAVGNAFHVPPAIIGGTASQLSDSIDTFIANAIDPLAYMLEQEITKKRYGESEFIKGNYILIDTTYVRHIDAISSANNIDKSIACGVLSPAQAQRYCGMIADTDEWATDHYMTKNYQTAYLAAEGGET